MDFDLIAAIGEVLKAYPMSKEVTARFIAQHSFVAERIVLSMRRACMSVFAGFRRTIWF